MKFFIIYCMCYYTMQQNPSAWNTFNYNPPHIKVHQKIRVTLKAATNISEINTRVNTDDFMSDMKSDPVNYISDLTKYNIRLNYKFKKRFKIFCGEETTSLLTGKRNVTYVGIRIKL